MLKHWGNVRTRIAFKKASNGSLAYNLSSLSFYNTATPSLEDYEQAYIVQTGFAEWKPKSNRVMHQSLISNLLLVYVFLNSVRSDFSH